MKIKTGLLEREVRFFCTLFTQELPTCFYILSTIKSNSCDTNEILPVDIDVLYHVDSDEEL